MRLTSKLSSGRVLHTCPRCYSNVAMKPPARLVGFNHAILEVGDIEENLSFYERLFKAALRGHGPGMAFIGAGDQFITLSEGWTQAPMVSAT